MVVRGRAHVFTAIAELATFCFYYPPKEQAQRMRRFAATSPVLAALVPLVGERADPEFIEQATVAGTGREIVVVIAIPSPP
jgi:hypothetical protein